MTLELPPISYFSELYLAGPAKTRLATHLAARVTVCDTEYDFNCLTDDVSPGVVPEWFKQDAEAAMLRVLRRYQHYMP